MAAQSEPKVKYVQLGKSGLRVSVPILGTLQFGDSKWLPWCLQEKEALPLLKAAYDLGITSWDTANMYSNGESERIVGKALKEYALPREKLIIMTKCFNPVGESPEIWSDKVADHQDPNYTNQGGLSRAAIFNQVNASLKRLGTDYIDLLQCHRYDYDTPIEETMEALHDLVKSGKVRYIGMSSCYAYQLANMQACADKHGWTKFVSMQNQYNLLYREEEREVNPFCREAGLGLIPWGPLSAGALARPLSSKGSTVRSSTSDKDLVGGGTNEYNRAADEEIVKRVEELAKKKGWTMSQVAIAWIQPNITSPIIGFSSVERMKEAIAANGKILTIEERKYLEEPYLHRPIAGHK